MKHTSVDIYLVIDTFLLLLIGIGPKIALVPFVEITAPLDGATKARIVRKMLTTATVVALILLGLGELLSRLLHFSTGSLSIAGGIILIIIAITMVLGSADAGDSEAVKGRDPMGIAVFPLAVPYLLNPAGIVALVTLSAEADSVAVFAMVLGVLALVLALDVGVFRLANRASDHLDESRMLVTEKIFGILLAALAVQLVLDGFDSLGLIHLPAPRIGVRPLSPPASARSCGRSRRTTRPRSRRRSSASAARAACLLRSAFAISAFVTLFTGLRLLVSNWRLTLIQILPAMWIWLAMFDLKAPPARQIIQRAARPSPHPNRSAHRRAHRGELLPQRRVRVRDLATGPHRDPPSRCAGPPALGADRSFRSDHGRGCSPSQRP